MTTKNPEIKMSPCLFQFTRTLDLTDDYRRLHPLDKAMSHYYTKNGEQGGIGIDQSYSYGQIIAVTAFLCPVSFSDHHTLVLSFEFPSNINISLSPKVNPLFKIQPWVFKDPTFQARLSEEIKYWSLVTDANMPILDT